MTLQLNMLEIFLDSKKEIDDTTIKDIRNLSDWKKKLNNQRQ